MISAAIPQVRSGADGTKGENIGNPAAARLTEYHAAE